MTTGSKVLIIGGGVLILGGVIFLLVKSSKKPGQSGAGTGIGAGTGSIAAGGTVALSNPATSGSGTISSDPVFNPNSSNSGPTNPIPAADDLTAEEKQHICSIPKYAHTAELDAARIKAGCPA